MATKKKATKKTPLLKEAAQPKTSGGYPASNIICDDVWMLNGMLETLLEGFGEQKNGHLYWMFSALHEVAQRLDDALDFFDENDYCGQTPPDRLLTLTAKEKEKLKTQAA